MNAYRCCEATRAELEAMDRYFDAVLACRAPEVEEYLEEFPEFAESLRPVLEGAGILVSEYRAFRKRYPGVNLVRLLGSPAGVQEKGRV